MCGDYNDIGSLKLNTFTYESENETLENDIFKKYPVHSERQCLKFLKELIDTPLSGKQDVKH